MASLGINDFEQTRKNITDKINEIKQQIGEIKDGEFDKIDEYNEKTEIARKWLLQHTQFLNDYFYICDNKDKIDFLIDVFKMKLNTPKITDYQYITRVNEIGVRLREIVVNNELTHGQHQQYKQITKNYDINDLFKFFYDTNGYMDRIYSINKFYYSAIGFALFVLSV